YVDESGDTTPLSQGGTKFLVLTACIISETERRNVEDKLRTIKNEFYTNPDVEFKSNFIRYANPDLPDYESPLKLHSRERYNDLEAKLASYLLEIPATLISVVISKVSYWEQYPSQNPYEIAYVFLLERIQKFLERNDTLGLIIIDPREGRVEKRFIGDRLESIHHSMRFSQGAAWYKTTSRIVERLLYSDSQNTVGIQLADLYCYPIFHIFEYDKEPQDYWRYAKVTSPKLDRIGNRLIGCGLKIFPYISKNGL
ncbi:MAG: DUF3800 domain-containing protein, partial [bacterium]|nr:DUF3800 domain-containing protein [bacterium]